LLYTEVLLVIAIDLTVAFGKLDGLEFRFWVWTQLYSKCAYGEAW